VTQNATETRWSALLAPECAASATVILSGVLLHSMNVLLTATVLPSVVQEVGGAAMMSWPITAFLASSIVAATCSGLFAATVGARRAYPIGAVILCAGALLCGFAPSMSVIIAGRFVQGFGGGILAALAYVLVRQVFPEALWARMFALLAGVWGISVLAGPLVGGIFANQGNWRGAFFAVAALAVLLAAIAHRALPRETTTSIAPAPTIPTLRVMMICFAIGAMSAAAVVSTLMTKAGLIVIAVAAFAVALWRDRKAATRLLPSDAFSLNTACGVGLWMGLLLSMTYSPFSVYGPLFLQRLHGLTPLAAGYVVAGASLFWTVGALAAAQFPAGWPARLLIAGPLIMGGGLAGIAAAMPNGPVVGLFLPVAMLGAGIGVCWAFVAQRVMLGCREGEGNTAATAVATVQQVGLAFGSAAAGLVANATGFATALVADEIRQAALWVPASFVVVACAASIAGLRLNRLVPR
jgi:MFS family permease